MNCGLHICTVDCTSVDCTSVDCTSVNCAFVLWTALCCGLYICAVDCTSVLWIVHLCCGLYICAVDCTSVLWTVLCCGLYICAVDFTSVNCAFVLWTVHLVVSHEVLHIVVCYSVCTVNRADVFLTKPLALHRNDQLVKFLLCRTLVWTKINGRLVKRFSLL